MWHWSRDAPVPVLLMSEAHPSLGDNHGGQPSGPCSHQRQKDPEYSLAGRWHLRFRTVQRRSLVLKSEIFNPSIFQIDKEPQKSHETLLDPGAGL